MHECMINHGNLLLASFGVDQYKNDMKFLEIRYIAYLSSSDMFTYDFG